MMIAVMTIDQPADEGVQENDKSCAKSRDEEKRLGSIGKALRQLVACESDEVEQEECSEAHSGVNLGVSKVFQGVDDDQVGGRSRVEALDLDSHHCRHLADRDTQCGAGHEGGNCSQRNEVDYPTTSNKADKTDNGTTDDGESGRNNMTRDIGVFICNLVDNVANDGRHDGHRTNGDILGSSEEPVNQNTHKGRVEAVLDRKFSKFRIGHTLRYHNGADSDTGDEISNKPLNIVSADPPGKGEKVSSIGAHISPAGQ